jgi:hypothetical protein
MSPLFATSISHKANEHLLKSMFQTTQSSNRKPASAWETESIHDCSPSPSRRSWAGGEADFPALSWIPVFMQVPRILSNDLGHSLQFSCRDHPGHLPRVAASWRCHWSFSISLPSTNECSFGVLFLFISSLMVDVEKKNAIRTTYANYRPQSQLLLTCILTRFFELVVPSICP